jgi:hypothetical protein
MLILLSDVVFLAEVNKVDDWLGREEKQRVNNLNLSNSMLAHALISFGEI